MSNAWQEGFKTALYLYLLENGSAVYGHYKPYENHGGWKDYERTYDTREHLEKCVLDLDECSYSDSGWVEFDGTFAEPQWGHRDGLDARLSCVCGHVDTHWRYTGSYADLMRGLTG